jgi:spermidine synthase
MKAWTTLARAQGLEQQELVLQQRDQVFVIRSGGRELMSSARHHSEEEMARIGLESLRTRTPTVLIGGLGLGYTVRATLDAMPPGGKVVVSEISDAVVEWNRTFLAELAGRPLEDPRVEVALADVAQVMREGKARFDCILLDVDNGPSAMSAQSNQQLYESKGIALMKSALRPGGVVVIWSAGQDAPFLKRLGKAGFQARVERSVARVGGSSAHVLFVGKL